jgi:predicted dehydrogenase
MAYRVGLIGAGGAGRKRATAVNSHHSSRLKAVFDLDTAAAQKLAAQTGATAAGSWREVVDDPAIDLIVVSTTHDALARLSRAALEAGKHVLCEKPVGRNPREVRGVVEAATASGRHLWAGYNHRFHPALARAREAAVSGELGEIDFVRARYGHGGRPGYESEWRGDPVKAGGGEMLDQGAHLVDLCLWLLGDFASVTGYTTTRFWKIEPLEDNAFGLFRSPSGQVASIHVSWTQWRNLFSFEIFGHEGYAVVDGLGGSYGSEQVRLGRRRPGEVPDEEVVEFTGEDLSWALEWAAIVDHLETGNRQGAAVGEEALATIEWIYRLYTASREGRVVGVGGEAVVDE